MVSLHIGQDIDLASSPGGTTTNCARSSASRWAASAAAPAFEELELEPSAQRFPFRSDAPS